MKKNICKFSIILVSVLLFCLSSSFVSAETGVYTYKDKTSGIKSSSFGTKELCEKERSQKFLTATTTECAETVAQEKPEVTNVNPQTTGSKASDDYNLLAPIGDYKTAPKNIGDYFNTILEIAIGLCAVLAVIMIVIGGIQYMGNESIFGKTEAKGRIVKSIFGLFIAIGAFALLNTIDPNLLGKKGLNIKQVALEIDPEVHGDTPHSPVNGKYCSSKYPINQAWGSDKAERTAVEKVGITVNKNNCTKVGDTNCTSLTGLDTSKVIALKQKCPTCEIIITGGTECWLHSSRTVHLPGNSIVDLRLTNSLITYVENKNKKIDSSGMSFPVFIKNITKFMREQDHYHIIDW